MTEWRELSEFHVLIAFFVLKSAFKYIDLIELSVVFHILLSLQGPL